MVAFSALTALSFTLVSTGAAYASPLDARSSTATLALTKYLNSTGTRNVVAQDQARAKALQAASRIDVRAGNVVATNAASAYTANVGIGTPPTYYTLMIDTGSSNTWVGAGGKNFVNTSTTVDEQQPISVFYGSGDVYGKEFLDTVTLGDSLTIDKQSFAVASQSDGLNEGMNGILGIGPTNLTMRFDAPPRLIPTVTDNLFTQKQIPECVVGISFKPTTMTGVSNGELTFGGVDPSKYTGYLNYVPLTTTEPASYYWGIDQSISYGDADAKPILPLTAGIVDTGTSMVLIASEAYDMYLSYTGAVEDTETGFLTISRERYDLLKSLYFHINGEIYELTADAQTWPRALNEHIGGKSDSIYLVVNSIGAPVGSGLDFINGYTFLERFYSVYDTAHSAVGLANTAYTKATVNA